MKKINEVRHLLYLPIILRHYLYKLIGANQFNRLRLEKSNQVENFNKLKKKFRSAFGVTSKYPFRKYVTETWRDFNSMMELALLPTPQFNFLNNPFIIFSMFMTKGGKLMREQIRYVEKVFGKKTSKLVLKEDIVGEPLIMNKKYTTSHNKINMLYHLSRFQERTGLKVSSFPSIIEWGSGYGGLVTVIKRLSKKPITYTCIDTPLVVCLQWLYLSSVFGSKSVNLIIKPTDKIKKNKINFIPVSLVEKIKISGNLFISTWALSESSKYSHDVVNKKKWFGANHLLLGYQKNISAFEGPERIGKYAKKDGAHVEEVGLFPDNYYAFK